MISITIQETQQIVRREYNIFESDLPTASTLVRKSSSSPLKAGNCNFL